jgi:hypothetical protein
MKEINQIPEFSLFGGPLHRLGCRMGLVRSGTNVVPLGVVLGLSAWAVLILLALMQGLGHKALSLAVIGIHVRLLMAIPLFFVCEAWVAPLMTEFVRNIVRSGFVPDNELPALKSEIARATRWQGSWFSEAICLLAAALLPLISSQLHLVGSTVRFDPSSAVAQGTLAGWWYWIVCLPLFRFLVFRWLLRLGLWSYFLWRVAKLELNLVPTHPDGAAGLGYLEVVHIHFTPLILAISAMQSASFAEEISAGTMTIESAYPAFVLILVLDAALFLGPLFIFGRKLWACRVKGLSDYMELAAHYVNGFDRKWLGKEAPPAEPLLGTPDLQSLADLSNSVSIVRNMRWVPLSPPLLINLAIPALLPVLPLLLFKYPLAELAAKCFSMLSGL